VSGDGDRLRRALAAWEEPSEGAAKEVVAAAEAFPRGSGDAGPEESALLHAFLERTSTPDFLCALPDAAHRERWTEACVAAIRRSHYTLASLFGHRARTIGSRALFEEHGRASPARWTYAAVESRTRRLAALFLEGGGKSRVALYLENSVDGAACDLACLLHGILVVPLSTHLGVDELAWILERLSITIAVTDSEERLLRLLDAGRRTARPLRLYSLSRNRVVDRGDAELLAAALARRSPGEVESARPGADLDEPATVMFTSGSTGRPKGVVFTSMNLVAKRFARAAALPGVGRDEVLLAYLPLFHTFGRYLEMLGMLFWRGTYVFAGNPSAETLFEGLRQVRPTGLIGIPLRWTQVRDRTLLAMEAAASPTAREAAFRGAVGDRLRWGLSAAGYLEPRVFQHFHRHGVELLSGFGMTEATGGITMSPPGDYRPHTVGRPLPGIRVRLTAAGEMQIAGPYVARYLAETGGDLEREPALEGEWIPTGDVFRALPDGHLCIVDRVKDIYKNDRGQTIAPQRVERKFHGVPGIRRAFLVGDHRSYNVLLVVPEIPCSATPPTRRAAASTSMPSWPTPTRTSRPTSGSSTSPCWTGISNPPAAS
jgi:long-subunit acyl-CoA synthetase (AMP-forming)